MKNLTLTLATDFCSVQIEKVKVPNGASDDTYYEITLTARVKYDGRSENSNGADNSGVIAEAEEMEMRTMSAVLENLGLKQLIKESQGIHELQLTGLRSLNTALAMLGLKTLSKDDEELLTDYVATRGDYGRDNERGLIQSCGIMSFGQGSIAISGVQSGMYNEGQIFDRKDEVSAKGIQEIIAKIRENILEPQ